MKYQFLKVNHRAAKIIQKKYIIGYNDDVIRPSCISLPQMNGYLNCFKDNDKTMSFAADDKDLLKEHTKIWEKN